MAVIATVSLVFGCCFALVPLLIVAAACATIAIVFFAIQIYRGFNDDKKKLFHQERKPWIEQETINLDDLQYQEWKNQFDNYHGRGAPLGHENLLKWLFYKHEDSGHLEIPKDLFEICNNQPRNIKRAHQ